MVTVAVTTFYFYTDRPSLPLNYNLVGAIHESPEKVFIKNQDGSFVNDPYNIKIGVTYNRVADPHFLLLHYYFLLKNGRSKPLPYNKKREGTETLPYFF